MTKAAKHFGKDLSNFWKSDDTSEYIKALLQTLPNPVKSTEFAHLKGKLIDSTMGRNGGTWAHPKLAVFFARWLESPTAHREAETAKAHRG